MNTVEEEEITPEAIINSQQDEVDCEELDWAKINWTEVSANFFVELF